MTFDKNEFFRQATLRICGNIEIENAMVSFLKYIQDFIPAERLFLQRFDKNLGVMRTIVEATLEKGERKDLLTPLSTEAKAFLKKKYTSNIPEAYFYEKPHEVPVSSELLASHNQRAKSLLVLPLGTSQHPVGVVVLLSKEREYNEEHTVLMSLLKEPFSIAMLNALRHLEVVQLKDILADDNRYLKDELHRLTGDEIVGANFGLKDVMHKINQVASLNSPVLLLGETGVGKDVIANAIHYMSSRSTGPFVSVNCGAIPESLIDSELFGHEKGAFTGALAQKRGRFERADKGTIFLDEIGELPLQAQVRFLKVLQSKEIERVGGVKPIQLDIRIIAATNRNLEEMIKRHEFREDLWYRLNVFPVWIPPLRDRKTDIPALLQHFIKKKSKELNLPTIPEIEPGAVDTLMEYNWPGNVRELENIVERAIILNQKGPLMFGDLNLSVQINSPELNSKGTEPPGHMRMPDNLDEMVSMHIQEILNRTGGKISGPGGASELLGVNPSTLRNRMKKLGIC